MTVAATPARARRGRALQVNAPVAAVQPGAQSASKVTPQMISLAQKAVLANAEKNKGTREEKSNVEALNKLMIAASIDKFNFTVEPSAGQFLSYEAVIAEGSKDVISVALLKTLVDDATFMKIVKATKGDIEELAGKNICVKVTSTVSTPAALKLKQLK